MRASPTVGGMRLLRLSLYVLCLTPALALAQRERLPPADLAQVRADYPEAIRTSTGLYTRVLEAGSGGLHPRAGDEVAVLYKGSLLSGKVFDQNNDPSKPFTFRLGRGLVIDGWEFGLPLMEVGERRLIIVPFELGYGSRGRSPDIPRMATLVFEVELLSVKRSP